MSGPLGVLLDLLFPPKCVFCGKVLDSGEDGLCARCQRDLPWLADGEAELTGEFFSLCAAPLRYQDKVRDSIRRYKFNGRRGYHKLYGKLVAQCTAQGKTLEELTLEELQAVSPLFEQDVYDALNLENCMALRSSYGGPAVSETARQIGEIEQFIQERS